MFKTWDTCEAQLLRQPSHAAAGVVFLPTAAMRRFEVDTERADGGAGGKTMSSDYLSIGMHGASTSSSGAGSVPREELIVGVQLAGFRHSIAELDVAVGTHLTPPSSPRLGFLQRSVTTREASCDPTVARHALFITMTSKLPSMTQRATIHVSCDNRECRGLSRPRTSPRLVLRIQWQPMLTVWRDVLLQHGEDVQGEVAGQGPPRAQRSPPCLATNAAIWCSARKAGATRSTHCAPPHSHSRQSPRRQSHITMAGFRTLVQTHIVKSVNKLSREGHHPCDHASNRCHIVNVS